MGIAERKEREKQEMRERILNAAMRLFVEFGFEKTSIRRIADAIEYSPATIYLYFKDKDEMFFELHRMAFWEFAKEFQRATLIQDPFERLRFIGHVYIEFALAHPEQYELMFIMKSPMKTVEKNESWEIGHQAFSVLEDTIKACMEQGKIKGKDYRMVSYGMWAQVHGLVSLAVCDRLTMYDEEDPKAHIVAAYEEMMDMLKV